MIVFGYFVAYASKLCIGLLVFVFFASVGVRLVMTQVFLVVEYTRLGFPVDVYGFTAQDRLAFSPLVLSNLLESRSVSELGDLFFFGSKSLFNERELRHLVDVSLAVQVFFLLSCVVIVALLLLAYFSFGQVTIRKLLRHGILLGSYLTIGLAVGIVVMAVVNWDFFFTTFHALLFADGTWVFEYSDTLIRLFPEQFWFDAAIVVGGIAVGLALLTIFTVPRLPYWNFDKPN
jgi:integral membrane protein (TIGR01906 family)